MTGRATTQIGQLTQGGRGGRKRGPLRVGRTTKLTAELSKKICDVVRAGNYVSVAARYCGVGERTLADWIARGNGTSERPSSRLYVQFVQDLEAAEAGSEVTAVLHWRAAMPKDWHSSERWLRTRLPERWGDKDDANARAGAFAGVQVNIGGLSGAQRGTNAPDMPISALLEDNPHLIGNVMQLLDQLLPISPESGESALLAPPNAEIGAKEVFSASESPDYDVYDAKEADWREIRANDDETAD